MILQADLELPANRSSTKKECTMYVHSSVILFFSIRHFVHTIHIMEHKLKLVEYFFNINVNLFFEIVFEHE